MPSGGSTLEIPAAAGSFGLALNLAPLNEQKKFAMFFFCRFQLQGGAPYYIHGVM